MKPSKNAMLNYVLGAGIVTFGGVASLLTNNLDGILLGIGGCALLWVMGIQRDLYGENPK